MVDSKLRTGRAIIERYKAVLDLKKSASTFLAMAKYYEHLYDDARSKEVAEASGGGAGSGAGGINGGSSPRGSNKGDVGKGGRDGGRDVGKESGKEGADMSSQYAILAVKAYGLCLQSIEGEPTLIAQVCDTWKESQALTNNIINNIYISLYTLYIGVLCKKIFSTYNLYILFY